MSKPSDARVDDLWAVTTYFNPAGYARRLANYRIFRQRLATPLVAVELAYGPDFELREGDADVLIHIRGGDVMWQKERLLNVALGSLPASCRKVAWVDCDIVFARDDWADEASRRLDDVSLLQPFSHVLYLPGDAPSGSFRPEDAKSIRPSIALTAASGFPAGDWATERRIWGYPPGFGLAWAARRETLVRHGLFDACIVGGGDRAIISAAAGAFDGLMDLQHMNSAQRRRYLAWAEPFHAEVDRVDGYIEGDLFHLWHGESARRSYVGRHSGLSAFDFDPFADIAVADSGAWRWNSDKPALHAFVRDYFASRGEDA
jgi:hypothetical protein